jgi:hypothetical protein
MPERSALVNIIALKIRDAERKEEPLARLLHWFFQASK